MASYHLMMSIRAAKKRYPYHPESLVNIVTEREQRTENLTLVHIAAVQGALYREVNGETPYSSK